MWKYITLSAAILTACAAAPPPPVSADVVAASTRAPTEYKGDTQAERFSAWKQNFTSRAIAKGYERAMVNRVIAPATFKAKAVADNNNQAEFVKPIWSYVQTAASKTRIANGQKKLAATQALFDDIEAAYGVDRHVLTAIWGLESAFGAVQGDYDAVSALASFAFEGRRMEFGEAQLFAILDLVGDGLVRPEQLKSSWAGAMGMTQFIPATFRDYAVDFDKDGNIDLWGNQGDALASAANYLSRFGWKPQEPVFAEVRLPDGFDYTLADGQARFLSVWQSLGVSPLQGGGFTDAAAMFEAKLYLPAGANGPVLLTFKNFDMIKRYNNSNSYAMGIATLAMNLSGKAGITSPWPEGDQPLTRDQKKNLQIALTAQGHDTGGIDGAIGPNSIKAIRAWQTANNVVPDGYVEYELYKTIAAKSGLKP